MRHCEEKGKSTLKSTFTTSFVPRQLLLSSASSKSIMAAQQKKNSVKPSNTLSSQDRDLLLHTICEFLELNGFQKTLKKFHREADIEVCISNLHISLLICIIVAVIIFFYLGNHCCLFLSDTLSYICMKLGTYNLWRGELKC